MGPEEALARRVQWTRPHVAVDHSERGQRYREQSSRVIRHRILQVPTGLADGLEVGSPLPSASALAGHGVTDAPLAAREFEPPVVPPYRALLPERRDGVRAARIRQLSL